MKQKYYPEFKNYPEFHKILLKTDVLLRQQQQIVATSPPPSIQTGTESSFMSMMAQTPTTPPSLSSPTSSSSPSNLMSPTSYAHANSNRLINDALASIDEDFIDSGYINESALDSSICSSGIVFVWECLSLVMNLI